MASHSAASSTPGSAGYRPDLPAPQHFPPPSVPPQPRLVWPWPVFLLGVAALVAVWYGRPYLRPTDAERVRRDLAEMRTLLGRSSPDMPRAFALGQKALDLGNSFPQFVGEAHYLLGCWHLKKAEEAADPAAEWGEARRHFEHAEIAGVPEADQPRLAFRLGKVLFLSKTDSKKALEYLKKGEDPDAAAERWQILAEAYMQQPEPDLKEAIAATNKQIADVRQGDGRMRAEGYHRLAELHLRSGQVALARKALEEIKVSDSTELYDSSRVLLARCHQADRSYALAAAAWEQVRSKTKPPIDRGVINFELGWCYWKAGRNEEARKAWDDAQAYSPEAAQASLIRKAEMLLADPSNRAQAVPILEDAFKTVHAPADYRNALIAKARVEELLEKTCLEFRTARDWASAGKVAELLTRVSGAARGKELAIDVSLAWGTSLQEETLKKSGQAAKLAAEESCKQFRTAATLASELAASGRPAAEQAEWLLRAAKYFLKCSDKIDVQNAFALLERIPKLSKGGPLDGEVIYLRAVAQEHLGEGEKAIEGYRACIQPGHPQLHRARYQLVRLLLARPAAGREEEVKLLDQAAEELAPNLEPAVRESHPEEAEQSTYLMGHIAYKRRDWAKAESQLTAALRLYPQSDEAVNSRFLVGRCYWFQAGRESLSVHNDKLPETERAAAKRRMNDLLEKAKQIFEPLENELIESERDQKLSDADKQILRQTSFAAAESYFFLEDFPEAVRRYNLLRLRYARQVEELIALAQLWLCYTVYLDKREQGDATLGALRDLLKSLPDDAFDGSANIFRRDYWEDWIQRASKPAAAAAGGGRKGAE